MTMYVKKDVIRLHVTEMLAFSTIKRTIIYTYIAAQFGGRKATGIAHARSLIDIASANVIGNAMVQVQPEEDTMRHSESPSPAFHC